MKKLLFVALFASFGLVSNARPVNMTITTSCGETYVIHEVGDPLPSKVLSEYLDYMEMVYCG